MNSKLYKLALWYIKKCNAKCKNRYYKEEVESLKRLTYLGFDKYLLLYGADAEWQIFNKYDALDNAIQRLAEYENIGTVEEFKALKEETNKKYLDDDSLLFCCKHGLSVNKSDYTETELAAIKAKALQEEQKYRNKNREKLYNFV